MVRFSPTLIPIKRMDEAIELAPMPENEQKRRMRTMTTAVESFTVQDWAEEQMDLDSFWHENPPAQSDPLLLIAGVLALLVLPRLDL